jgi:hypothetical protein
MSIKIQSLRRKFMGSDWKFSIDEKYPKTSRRDQDDIKEIDEKFKKIQIISPKPLDHQQSEPMLGNLQPKKTLKHVASENFSKPRYRSPWYIDPKQWNYLAKAPETNRNYIENRSKNLYYFLHKREPDLNPLKKPTSITSNKYETQYNQTQNKLASLGTVQNYKK